MMKGKFIVFEGVDGSGKSTQAQLLTRYINEHKGKAIYTREPGGCHVSEQIRSILLAQEIPDPLTEFLLFSAARREHVKTVIEPSLENGITIICDRFYGSSLVYQCYVKGLDLNFALGVTDYVVDKCHPDQTFLLDLAPDNIMSRVSNITREINHYDQKDQDFYAKIRNGFLHLAHRYNWHILNAASNIDDLHNQITRLV